MRILVIDDNPFHLQTALSTLADHEVTTCPSHEKTIELLGKACTHYNKTRDAYMAEGFSTTEACQKALDDPPLWEVVLCDLLMPAAKESQSGAGKKYVGQEMPVGWALALTAIAYHAKYVAVVTDINHHLHPASAMLDRIQTRIFTVDNARLLMTNHIRLISIEGTEHDCTECKATGRVIDERGYEWRCGSCQGAGRVLAKGKDWSKILDALLNKKEIQGLIYSGEPCLSKHPGSPPFLWF